MSAHATFDEADLMIRSFDIAPGHPPKCPHELKKEVLYAKPFKGMQYTEGQKVFGPEDQLAFYSSGRVAVCVNEQPGGFFITAFDDTHEHPTIASFDPFGVGSVSYPSGQPRLTVDMTGATLYRENGSIEHRGLWETPRYYKDDPDAPTIVKPRYLRLNERLALDFRDRVNNELIFFCDGEYRYWVGQRLKRKEGSYLLNNSGLFKYGQMRGRYQIDKETRIYAASDAVADAAKNRFKITGDIQGLLEIAEACEKSSHYIETTPTMKVAPHITVPDKHKAHATMFPELAGGGNRAAERFHAERQIAQMKQKVHAQKEADLTVEAGRRRMPQITRKYYEEVINLCNDNKQLLVVCSLGGWVKESTEMRKELEVLNATLYKVYEKKNSDPKKEPPPCTGTKADGGHSMPFRLVRWDPTKDPMLRERYGVNSVPLFLFYYSKQLIGIKRRWNGYGQTKKDLIIELRAMQVNGERGRFLPADYKPAPPSLMK